MEQTDLASCTFRDSLELLGRRHALELLWTLQQRTPQRFTELKRSLSLNPVTLHERLNDFEAAGVVTRRVFNETPPRVEYDLTRKGRDLLVLLEGIEKWSKRHASADG